MRQQSAKQTEHYHFRVDYIDEGHHKCFYVDDNFMQLHIALSTPQCVTIVGVMEKQLTIIQFTRQITNKKTINIPISNRFTIVTNNCDHLVIHNSTQAYLINIKNSQIKRIPLLLRQNEMISRIFFQKESVLIALNTLELFGWGDNREGQLGLFLRTFYHKPEVICVGQHLPNQISHISFTNSQTILIDSKNNVYYCKRNKKLELNFQGFAKLNQGQQLSIKQLHQFFVPQSHLDNMARIGQFDKLQAVSEGLLKYTKIASQSVLIYNHQNKHFIQFDQKVVIDFLFTQTSSSVISDLQNKAFIDKLIIQILASNQNSFITQGSEHSESYEMQIADLRRQFEQQRAIIELQDNLIHQLHKKMNQNSAIQPPHDNNLHIKTFKANQLFDGLSKLSKLRRLLQTIRM